MASRDPSRLIGHIVDSLRGNTQGSELWACVANAANFTLFPNRRDTNAGLSGADNYPGLFAGALEYSTFPHVRRPPRAELLGIHTRVIA